MNQRQHRLATRFRDLHVGGTSFVIPNPWDIGSARMMCHLGFPALAGSSAGCAFSNGVEDGKVARERMLGHIAEIAGACELPFSADLGNGFGDDPETVAETIRLAAAAGAVGASIEDATGRRDDPVYPLDVAVERIEAAVAAARRLPFPFVLTARADNFIIGREDLDDTIRRLQAFQQAGADVLFAPGLRRLEDIRAVVAAIDRPLNVMMGLPGIEYAVADLRAAGATRVSLGASLARRAFAALHDALTEVSGPGTFTYAGQALAAGDLVRMFRAGHVDPAQA
ncbi:MAG TPA: isocitrate lyase/phosphoenolpyruvate mutase family protein [Noviherbaspirillum sp.]|nr:isocitrate lyase/phosphoenolpyruvate mutase family protein [Noviherbaspirillum sp.]